MSVAQESLSTAIDELTNIFADRITTNVSVRDTHSRDESWHHPHKPDAVIFPQTTEEVSKIVTVCARYKTPIIAYGTLRNPRSSGIHNGITGNKTASDDGQYNASKTNRFGTVLYNTVSDNRPRNQNYANHFHRC